MEKGELRCPKCKVTGISKVEKLNKIVYHCKKCHHVWIQYTLKN